MLALAACDDEEAEPIDLGPTGPPRIEFTDPPSDGIQPACLSIGTRPEMAQVPLFVQNTELVLRPPGACGTFAQCGHLVLFVDEVENNRSAVPAIDLLFRKLADPYHDGEPHIGTGEPDVLHVRVEAHDDADQVMLDHDGEEIVDEIEVISVEDCVGPRRDPPD